MMLASLILGSAPSARRGHVLVMPPSARCSSPPVHYLGLEPVQLAEIVAAAFGDVLLSGYPVISLIVLPTGSR